MVLNNSRVPLKGLLVPQDFDSFFWHWQKSDFIECRTDIRDHLKKTFPERYNKSTKISPKYVTVMADFRDTLYKIGVAPLLSGGTLLGNRLNTIKTFRAKSRTKC